MKRLFVTLVLVIASIALLAACGGNKPDTPIQKLKAPDWVIKGGGAMQENGKNVFYGVGSAIGIRNNSLLRSTADNRARNDLAKTFKFYSASLMKDYMASTLSDDPNVTSEEQHVEQAIKTVTSQTLSGVQVADHWQHPATMEMYSLVKLDLDAFKDKLDQVQGLDKRVKEHIKQNADRLHDELERQTK